MALMPYCFDDETESAAEKWCRVNNVTIEKIRSFEELLSSVRNGKYRVEYYFDNASNEDKELMIKLASNAIFGANQLLTSDQINPYKKSRLRDFTLEGQLKISAFFENLASLRRRMLPPVVTKKEFLLINQSSEE
ncbi:hypothetical protein [Haemophilus haemolyticus]|uniref:Uncharacterized protein n=1 Tax=Haemophilus haemolyticus TaxID=726 RepID=A0A852PWK9_HAEHA|nr:hypothetical protein [Haemophilus haemolyticus]NYA28101.1 hypothetical protein [Haemophilus haemolyticus]